LIRLDLIRKRDQEPKRHVDGAEPPSGLSADAKSVGAAVVGRTDAASKASRIFGSGAVFAAAAGVC
jgi:hypothetical protein